MISYEQFCENCALLEKRVADACKKCGRDVCDVRILPVTKTHPLTAIEYCERYGFKSVGENKVQEIVEKFGKDRSAYPTIECELIGHLQTNKARNAVELVSRIQSVDSIKILNKIDVEAEKVNKVIRVLLQINAGNDPAKFGEDIANAPALLECALSKKYLRVDGLMTIAPLDANLDVATRCFANLRTLRDNLQDSFKVSLPELSMGMSGDLENAIECGSTMIRVGSFLFGARAYSH